MNHLLFNYHVTMYLMHVLIFICTTDLSIVQTNYTSISIPSMGTDFSLISSTRWQVGGVVSKLGCRAGDPSLKPEWGAGKNMSTPYCFPLLWMALYAADPL